MSAKTQAQAIDIYQAAKVFAQLADHRGRRLQLALLGDGVIGLAAASRGYYYYPDDKAKCGQLISVIKSNWAMAWWCKRHKVFSRTSRPEPPTKDKSYGDWTEAFLGWVHERVGPELASKYANEIADSICDHLVTNRKDLLQPGVPLSAKGQQKLKRKNQKRRDQADKTNRFRQLLGNINPSLYHQE